MNSCKKSSTDEIKERFSNDVECFSNLQTGQVSILDAKIMFEIGTETAKRLAPNAKNILDLGCGAGNWTLKMLEKIPNANCSLLDISQAMLDKAKSRVSSATKGTVNTLLGDMRTVELSCNSFDIIFAGATLHHLRSDVEWKSVFLKIFNCLSSVGCFIISDLVVQNNPLLTKYVYEGWSNYLEQTGGKNYCKQILELSGKEDTPRSVNFLTKTLCESGFSNVEVLHKNMCFALICAEKSVLNSNK
ncbi:MAG: class I SAM-dependent methyltransferase [Elusimicrobiota bacterium]|jgi:tRNA (cmo5U34)-methyltransferase|nr:class I SAM-dependent methyltransferase [Elusimicrobiota bacterium]